MRDLLKPNIPLCMQLLHTAYAVLRKQRQQALLICNQVERGTRFIIGNCICFLLLSSELQTQRLWRTSTPCLTLVMSPRPHQDLLSRVTQKGGHTEKSTSKFTPADCHFCSCSLTTEVTFLVLMVLVMSTFNLWKGSAFSCSGSQSYPSHCGNLISHST